MSLAESTTKRAERRAAPWASPVPASRETRLALRPSKPAQARSAQRLAFPSADRPTYPSDRGLQ
jgi:hypothetical protein